MLRITTRENDDFVEVQLEGRLSGPWVTELERTLLQLTADHGRWPESVDLKDLTGADQSGRALLEHLNRMGTKWSNANGLTASILGTAREQR